MIRILAGTNNFALRTELRRVVADFAAAYGDMADTLLERLDGEDATFERMQEALQSLPFLADKKLVILEKPGLNKQFMEHTARLLQELPETTDLVMVEPKLDKRSAYYKFLKKQPGYHEFAELDENGLAQWLVKTTKVSDVTLSTADARYLVDRTGAGQQVLAQEIEKLVLYAQGRAATGAAAATIDRAAIDALTPANPRSTIFQLLEAAFAGNLRRSLQLYDEQRAQKIEPQQIIAMLAWQLHVIALAKAAGPGKTPDQIASDAGISPYTVRKSAGVASSLSVTRTRQLVADLLEIDHRLKRESIDADDAVKAYLIGLSM